MQLNDKVYSTLKWVVQIFMPALITLYTGLASAWDWDHVVPTTTTLAAVTTFLGVLLGLSSSSRRTSQRLVRCNRLVSIPTLAWRTWQSSLLGSLALFLLVSRP
jgi:hypothetical protein